MVSWAHPSIQTKRHLDRFSRFCRAHYTVSHKKQSQLIFVCCFVKNQRILMQLPLLELMMNDTWRYELHPPHLIKCCYTTLWKSKRILQWNITKEIAANISYMLHRNGPVDHKSWGVVQQCVYETKICDIYDLQNAWHKLGLTLNRRLNRGCDWPVARQSVIMYACWCGHFEHVLRNYCLFVLYM